MSATEQDLKKQCLLDLKGKCHYYTGEVPIEDIYSFHSEIAQLILPNNSDALTALLNLGWFVVFSHIHGGTYTNKQGFVNNKQYLALKKLGITHYFEGTNLKKVE
jgi:hypothetical protein